MKTILGCAIVTLTMLGVSAYGVAASGDALNNQGTMQTSASATAPLVEGLVKKVNKHTGKVTIAHGPLPNGMPAMTMAFRVKEAKWLNNMKPGQKIRFAEGEINDVMTVVQFEVVK